MKKIINSDGQQFHQYQQNKQSELITSHLKSLNMKKTLTYGISNQHPFLGQAQQCDKVKQVNKIKALPS